MKRTTSAWLVAAVCLAGCGPATRTPTAPRTEVAPSPTPLTAAEDKRGHCTLEQLDIPLIAASDAQWGSPVAPVALIVFSDFECPYCAEERVALDALRAKYGPERLRVIWKHTPLSRHPRARPTAEAAEGVRALAGNDAFWVFHDLAFTHQSELTQASFEAWAQQAGVKEIDDYTRGLRERRFSLKVERDLALASRIGVRATPSMIINGAMVEGLLTAEELSPLIEQALEGAPANAEGFACEQMRKGWSPTP